jgi:lysozyme
MYKRMLKIKILALILALCALLSGCGSLHWGQVQVNDGTGEVWITPEKNVPVSTFTSDQFSLDEKGEPVFTGTGYTVMKGVDVSYYQGDIDWKAVRADGVEFAFIRCGYRGYSEGAVNEDEKFTANIKGALEAGIKVGVYFFSQAVTVQEAQEEAQFTLKQIAGYDVTLPVVFDWERIDSAGEARTNDLASETLTACALKFCQTVKAAGYEPGVYFYTNTGYYGYELAQLTDYVFWLSEPGDSPDFYYAHSIWQYSFKGTVDGISGSTDLDMYFTPVKSA